MSSLLTEAWNIQNAVARGLEEVSKDEKERRKIARGVAAMGATNVKRAGRGTGEREHPDRLLRRQRSASYARELGQHPASTHVKDKHIFKIHDKAKAAGRRLRVSTVTTGGPRESVNDMFGGLVEAIRLEARGEEKQRRQRMAQKASGMPMRGTLAKKMYRGNVRGRTPDPLAAKARRGEKSRRDIMKAAAKEGQRIRFRKADLPR